jgi:N-acetylneuraminic acid mutarotase
MNITECSAVAWDGYLYVIGGVGNETDVIYAKIDADGSIDPTWNVVSLGVTRERHSSVVNNGYIYVIGGTADSGTTSLDTVRYAKINSGSPPTIGSWQTTSSLVNAVYGHTSVVFNGYIYVAGGVDPSFPPFFVRASVQYAAFE